MKRLLATAVLACAGLTTTRAIDVSGRYENIGTVIATTLPGAEAGVTFRGLTALEFDLPLARALHSGPAVLTLEQGRNSFTIRSFASDGAEEWNGRWERGVGYTVEGNRVLLIFRAKRFGDDGFLFTLTAPGDEKLLVVDIERIHATFLGPVMKPIGTFLFSRQAGEAPANFK